MVPNKLLIIGSNRKRSTDTRYPFTVKVTGSLIPFAARKRYTLHYDAYILAMTYYCINITASHRLSVKVRIYLLL